MNEFQSFISTVGFPIAVACVCMYYVKYQNDKHREEVSMLNDKHHEEMKQVTQAINNNTVVVSQLCEILKK